MSSINVNVVKNNTGGAPDFPAGATVTGVVTATTFKGSGAELTGIDSTALKDGSGNVKVQANSTGVVVTGVITATTFDGVTTFLPDSPGESTIAGFGTAGSGSADYTSPDIVHADTSSMHSGFFTFVRPANTWTMNTKPEGTEHAEMVEFFKYAKSGSSFLMKDTWNGSYSTHREYTINTAVTDQGSGVYTFGTSTGFSIPAGGPSSGSQTLYGNNFRGPFNVKYDSSKVVTVITGTANPAFSTSLSDVTINGVSYPTSEWTVTGTGATHTGGSAPISGISTGQLISPRAKVATSGDYNDLRNLPDIAALTARVQALEDA